MYHSVDAPRASEYRHADDVDFNGFHGYLGHSVSQWKTVYHSVDALRASGRSYTDDAYFHGLNDLTKMRDFD